MQAWIKGLTAAVAVVSLGGLAYGCDQAADSDDGHRVISYSDGTSVEEPINTSYEGPAPRGEFAPPVYGPAPSRQRQVQIPAPGFDRDMDAYQHPRNIRENIYGARQNVYGPSATLSAPNAQVPNGTPDNTQSVFEREPRMRAQAEAPAPAIRTGADRVEDVNARVTPPAIQNPAPAAPAPVGPPAPPAASEEKPATPPSGPDVTSTSNNPGPEVDTTGTPRAAQTPSTPSATEVMPAATAANSSSNAPAMPPSGPDVTSTSNNPGPEVGTTGAPRAAQSPSSKDNGGEK